MEEFELAARNKSVLSECQLFLNIQNILCSFFIEKARKTYICFHTFSSILCFGLFALDTGYSSALEHLVLRSLCHTISTLEGGPIVWEAYCLLLELIINYKYCNGISNGTTNLYDIPLDKTKHLC